jgi:hypothetical protein
MQQEKMRGAGAILVAVAATLFAEHGGMPPWEVSAVFVLMALGLMLLVNGRLSMR